MNWNTGRQIVSRTGYLLLALRISLLFALAIWVALTCGLHQVIHERRSRKAASPVLPDTSATDKQF